MSLAIDLRGPARCLGAIALVLLLGAQGAKAETPARLPVFMLPDPDGRLWDSRRFAGKPVVVDFWATWCGACRETIPTLAELSEKHKAKGLTVIGISIDKGSGEKVRKAAKKLGINYIVLLDKENSLSGAFGFTGIPSVYVFDRKGRLTRGWAGFDADQEPQLVAAVEKAL